MARGRAPLGTRGRARDRRQRRAQYAAQAEEARAKADVPPEEGPDARAQALRGLASKLGHPHTLN
jgi:hypothetical protein